MPDAPGWQLSPAHFHAGRRLSPPGRGLLPVRGKNISCEREKCVSRTRLLRGGLA